jgi:hypothetical protein
MMGCVALSVHQVQGGEGPEIMYSTPTLLFLFLFMSIHHTTHIIVIIIYFQVTIVQFESNGPSRTRGDEFHSKIAHKAPVRAVVSVK